MPQRRFAGRGFGSLTRLLRSHLLAVSGRSATHPGGVSCLSDGYMCICICFYIVYIEHIVLGNYLYIHPVRAPAPRRRSLHVVIPGCHRLSQVVPGCPRLFQMIYIYINIYIYTYIFRHTTVHICTYIYFSLLMIIYICIDMYMYIYICIHIHLYIYIYIWPGAI